VTCGVRRYLAPEVPPQESGRQVDDAHGDRLDRGAVPTLPQSFGQAAQQGHEPLVERVEFVDERVRYVVAEEVLAAVPQEDGCRRRSFGDEVEWRKGGGHGGVHRRGGGLSRELGVDAGALAVEEALGGPEPQLRHQAVP
jgi:hypothetical protein